MSALRDQSHRRPWPDLRERLHLHRRGDRDRAPSIKTQTLVRIQEVVAEAQLRADALMAEHHDAIIIVATAIYEKRRLTDERLDAVLESAGFTLPRPTA